MTKINKEGWEIKKLGEVARIIMGQSPDGNSINENKGIEFHQGKTFFGEKYLGISNSFTDSPIKLAKAHSLLLCVRAPVGFPNITDREICIGRGIASVAPSETTTIDFLFYSLLHQQSYFERNATGSTFKAISSKVISNTPIPLPPLPIQQRIVEELDEINAIISAKKQQLSKLDELAQSIFYNMFGDPVSNEMGWEVKTIGEVCQLKSGDSKANNSPEGDLPYVKVGDMNLPGNEEYITCSSKYVDYETNIKAIFPIGTIIFPKRGGAILTNKKRLTKVEVCCDLNTMGVIPSEALLSKYLYVWFKLLDLGAVCSGSTILQLNNCDIAPLKIALPPLPLQEAFAARVAAIEEEKAAIAASIEKMQTLLDARMQKYFG